MPTLSPLVFADGSTVNIPSAALGVVVVAIVVGIIKGAAWLLDRRAKAEAAAAAPAEPCHWAEVTGEQRPVTAQECSTRMGGLTESIQVIKDTMIRMEEQLGSGVELRIKEAAEGAADKVMGRHETGYHSGDKRR
jgi:hypothetical protein